MYIYIYIDGRERGRVDMGVSDKGYTPKMTVLLPKMVVIQQRVWGHLICRYQASHLKLAASDNKSLFSD